MTLSIRYSTMRKQNAMFLRYNLWQIFEILSSDYISVVQFFQDTMLEGRIYWVT